jgi:hypothetical protein
VQPEKEFAAKVANESTRELAERERRKANLVWFGVPESKAEDVQSRVKADSKLFTDLCGRALGVDLEITSCNRLRAKKIDEPRPLLMTVKDSSKVGAVLREARKLRGNTEFSGIFVKRDCTPLERTEMKRLMEERDRKREETKSTGGDENWIIRHGKVVNVTRRHVEKPKEGAQEAVAMVGEKDKENSRERE